MDYHTEKIENGTKTIFENRTTQNFLKKMKNIDPDFRSGQSLKQDKNSEHHT